MILKIQICQPIWPEKFKQDFVDQESHWWSKGQTPGTLYYNINKNLLRLDKQNGKSDKFCGPNFLYQSTPCNQYVSNGKRYLHFPEKNFCCLCCTAEQGCGINKNDWMKSAKKVREFIDKGVIYEEWKMDDLFITNMKRNQIIVQMKNSNREIDFDPESMTMFFEDKIFDLPEICNPEKSCGKLSSCNYL